MSLGSWTSLQTFSQFRYMDKARYKIIGLFNKMFISLAKNNISLLVSIYQKLNTL